MSKHSDENLAGTMALNMSKAPTWTVKLSQLAESKAAVAGCSEALQWQDAAQQAVNKTDKRQSITFGVA